MCDITAAMILGGLQVAEGVANYQQQKAEAEYQNQRSAQNRISATNARDLKIRQLALRNTQEQEQATQEKLDLQLEQKELKAKATLAAANAGVAGNSVDQLLRNYDADLLKGLQQIDSDSDDQMYQLAMERQGLEAEALNRIASVPKAMKPSLGAALIGAAASGATTYYANS